MIRVRRAAVTVLLAATACSPPGVLKPGGGSKPSATPRAKASASASTAAKGLELDLAGVPPAKAARVRLAATRLVAIAEFGFAQNRAGRPDSAASGDRVGVLGQDGTTLISDGGLQLISDGGLQLISDGGLQGKRAGGYALTQATAPSLGPEPGETLIGDRLLVGDKGRVKVFIKGPDLSGRSRKLWLTAEGKPREETLTTPKEFWPGEVKRIKRAANVTRYFLPDGTLRNVNSLEYQADEAGAPVAVSLVPGESFYKSDALGVDVLFDKFEASLVTKRGAFRYVYRKLGVIEEGTLANVLPRLNREIEVNFGDPLALYDGESTISSASGEVLFRKRQRTADGKRVRSYDMLDGLEAELTLGGDGEFAGTLVDGGTELGPLTMRVAENGTTIFRLTLAERPGAPVTFGYGMATSATPEPPKQEQLILAAAGHVQPGFADGPAGSARFNRPYGLALSRRSIDVLYVADAGNRRIRKVFQVGNELRVETVAGSGAAGSSDGPAASATFQHPVGLAVGPDETIYVTDDVARRVRAISPDGKVTTIAGDGQAGWVDGPGTSARFTDVAGIAYDPIGRLILADPTNHRVRAIDLTQPDKPVSTLAGGEKGFQDGMGSQARFDLPVALAIDDRRRVYVSELGNARVRRIDLAAAGTPVETVIGSGDPTRADFDGKPLEAGIGPVVALAWAAGPGGALLLGGHDLRSLSFDQELLITVAGVAGKGFQDGAVDEAKFQSIGGLAVGRNNMVWIADGNLIRGAVSGKKSP